MTNGPVHTCPSGPSSSKVSLSSAGGDGTESACSRGFVAHATASAVVTTSTTTPAMSAGLAIEPLDHEAEAGELQQRERPDSDDGRSADGAARQRAQDDCQRDPC